MLCSRTGRPYAHNHAGEAFRAAVQRPGIQHSGRLSLHRLRHSYASMLIASGLNVVFASRQPGHANPRVTLGTYAHLYAQADHAATARAAIEASYESLPRTQSTSADDPPMETIVVTDRGEPSAKN